ncbi:hypothetical protein CLV47_109110 [Antricoccus suffuscus]|uniref:Uncharacterized protein n=1 Tax=Antricoccus suffuscus TaxID=1629062 RepID=A0A2T0ZYY8_9ACTN|nr:hypothetical protein [Antricoccus suffuscus]PRZ41563.1 hypothetical protein CLV47_109110 [Antricoccus suffuscus]
MATLQTPLHPSALRRIAAAYREDMGRRERSILVSWAGFTGSFAAVRAITHAIHAGKGPFKNLSVGGEHLHHYMWGIASLAGVGALEVAGKEQRRHHPMVALAYGFGLALIVDEFALLLDLKDVYWAKQGRISVDLGIATVALGGTAFAATPLWRRLLDKSWSDRRSAVIARSPRTATAT